MSPVSAPSGWGPSHQTKRRGGPTWARWVVAGLVAGYFCSAAGLALALVVGGTLVLIGLGALGRRCRARRAGGDARPAGG